jgi:hypothetical protein
MVTLRDGLLAASSWGKHILHREDIKYFVV